MNNENSKSMCDFVEAEYRRLRSDGRSALLAREGALKSLRDTLRNSSIDYEISVRLRADGEAHLNKVSAEDVLMEAAKNAVDALSDPGSLSATESNRVRELLRKLREGGLKKEADHVELALLREALRTIVRKSNEESVRDLAWLALGL